MMQSAEPTGLAPILVSCFPEEELRPETLREPKRTTWRQQAQLLRDQVQILWFILQDPRTPWYAKMAVACAVGYLFSPIQLIPSFIPVIGFLDDFLALSVGFKLAHWLAPKAVVRDARERALISARQKGLQVPTLASRAGLAVVAVVWLVLMAAGMVWMYKP